jgi:hypothetical protein
MNVVCKEFSGLPSNPAGQHIHPSGGVILSGMIVIASEFVTLHDARVSADYNTAIPWNHFEAEAQVASAELAFGEWPAVQADPGTDFFLTELWCRGIPKRS